MACVEALTYVAPVLDVVTEAAVDDAEVVLGSEVEALCDACCWTSSATCGLTVWNMLLSS